MYSHTFSVRVNSLNLVYLLGKVRYRRKRELTHIFDELEYAGFNPRERTAFTSFYVVEDMDALRTISKAFEEALG